MSRTIRRKNENWLQVLYFGYGVEMVGKEVTFRSKYSGGHAVERSPRYYNGGVSSGKMHEIRVKAKFHSDGLSVRSSSRLPINKIHRAKSEMALRTSIARCAESELIISNTF